MGRWQTNYYDEVLGSKFKSLVQGAIARAKLEKGDATAPPSISYETLVQSLDHGDSFTTSLVDILVKELAERQTRSNLSDRHLIADRTVTSLQDLARIRAYRDRTSNPHRHFPEFFVARGPGNGPLDWDMLTQNADEEDIDVEDVVVPNSPPLRSVNLENGAVYPFSSDTTIRRSFPVQTQPTDPDTDEEVPSTMGYPIRRSPPASAFTAHHTVLRHGNLARQSSIRRPARSRTSDFNEFTTRRRTTGRQEQGSQAGPEGATRASGFNSNIASGSGEPSSSMDIANLLHNHHSRGNATEEIDGAMPVSAFASAGRRFVARMRPSEDRERDGSGSIETPSNARLFMLHTTGSSNGAAPSSSRLTTNAPRLRRGGVRAPEQFAPAPVDGYTHNVRINSPPIPGLANQEDGPRFVQRRSSSAEMEYIIQAASERFGSRSPRSRSPLSVWSGTWNGSTNANAGTSTGSAAGEPQESASTPTNLPTPRSISPEGPPASRQT